MRVPGFGVGREARVGSGARGDDGSTAAGQPQLQQGSPAGNRRRCVAEPAGRSHACTRMHACAAAKPASARGTEPRKREKKKRAPSSKALGTLCEPGRTGPLLPYSSRSYTTHDRLLLRAVDWLAQPPVQLTGQPLPPLPPSPPSPTRAQLSDGPVPRAPPPRPGRSGGLPCPYRGRRHGQPLLPHSGGDKRGRRQGRKHPKRDGRTEAQGRCFSLQKGEGGYGEGVRGGEPATSKKRHKTGG